MKKAELKEYLDTKAEQYNQSFFVGHDPLQIPHRFSIKQDIEIAGFLAATIAWGNRKSIIKNADRMMQLMDNSPYDFVLNFKDKDLEKLQGFVHRTFNAEDFIFMLRRLRALYLNHESMESLFLIKEEEINPKFAIERFRSFILNEQDIRTKKHISSPAKNSAAKRINMFLRWMVRQDKQGVDLGIWHQVPMSKLSIPLDVHTGRVGRELGLLHRHQNDWKAVEELDTYLRKLDPKDPVKYDFALFGIGAFEHF